MDPERAGRFPALRERGYRLFFFAQIISLSGTWMQSAAQGWLVLNITDSSFWLGAVSAAMAVPILVLSLMGGALADRLPKRTLLIITQAAAVVPALVLGTAVVLDRATIGLVMAMAVLLVPSIPLISRSGSPFSWNLREGKHWATPSP